MTDSPHSTQISHEILSHYQSGYEAERLSRGTSRLELARTQELVERYLPPPPAVIRDVGGDPGVYSCWLAIAKQGRRKGLMCRSIKQLRRHERPPTDEELREAALQFVRKVSGYRVPSKANEAAFNRAVADIANSTRRMFSDLMTK